MMVTRYFLILSCFFVCNFQLKAQLTNSGAGARAMGMANTSVTSNDLWAVQNNIAGLAVFENTEAGAYFQNRFGINGFNTMSFAAAYNSGYGVGGIHLQKFGDDLYNEQSIGFGYAHKLDFVSLGVKANIIQLTIQELGSKQAVALEFGGIVDITKELKFGANIYNLNQAKLQDYQDERFSTVLKAGISYRPIEKLKLNIEAEKDVDHGPNTKAGLEYWLVEKVAFRTGFSTLYRSGYFGVGLKYKKFLLDYALSTHSELGISNHISLNFIIKEREEEKVAEE